jgi:hypothetical protein
MPSLPRPRRTPQAPREPLEAKAIRLAVQLTPMQRHLVARAGLPRWLDLPLPFAPHPGRQLAAARALASREYGLIEPTLTDPLAYQLTVLGEVVAGIWLTAAFGDRGDLESLAGPSFMPSRYR